MNPTTHTHKELFPQIAAFLEQNKYGILEILGPTASGKTGYSIRLAHELKRYRNFDFEIISVDSRQIYHGFNIGAAKITEEEAEGFPHHGIDIAYPDETFSAYDFQRYAYKKIEEIHERGKRVMLVGGTMLWLDAISENYKFHEEDNTEGTRGVREESTTKSYDEQSLHAELPNGKPETNAARGENSAQERTVPKSQKKGPPLYPFFKIGLHWGRNKLYQRCDERAKFQFSNGLIEETRDILKQYEPSKSAFSSFGYQEIKAYLDGEIGFEEALAKNQKRNRNYAKRQTTWWNGRDDVVWLDAEHM